MLENYIPKISLTIVALVSVYIFDWLFIRLDKEISPSIRSNLENLISNIFNKNFSFSGHLYYLPNFIFFIILLMLILPFFMDFGIKNITPLLEGYLKEGILSFLFLVIIIFFILYLLFKQFYYKLKNH